MITKEDLVGWFGECLFDVTAVVGHGRFRTLCYLRQKTEAENINDPDLYLRFCENRSVFRLEKITKITEDNLHLYKNYEVNTLI